MKYFELLKRVKHTLDKKLDAFASNTKGALDPIEGIFLFVTAAVVIYILPGILAGVQSATPAVANTSPLYNASVSSQVSIASGLGLVSLTPLVIAVVVILAVLMLIRKKSE